MISKNQIKFIRSLQLKKNRDANNCFIAEGEKIINELLKLKKSKLRPKSKSNFVRIITELLKKYVLKDFAVQTKKDLFIKKYLIN